MTLHLYASEIGYSEQGLEALHLNIMYESVFTAMNVRQLTYLTWFPQIPAEARPSLAALALVK